ncbi:hypothetical protein Tco_0592906 [Tanacetum coccineum]
MEGIEKRYQVDYDKQQLERVLRRLVLTTIRLKLNSLEAKRTLAVKEVASIWNILWKLAISRIVVSWDIVLLDKIMSIKVHLGALATAACHGKDSYGLLSCEGNPMYLILILDEWVLGTAMASYVSNLHKEGFMP